MDRRNFIRGIGTAICAGAAYPFVPSLIGAGACRTNHVANLVDRFEKQIALSGFYIQCSTPSGLNWYTDQYLARNTKPLHQEETNAQIYGNSIIHQLHPHASTAPTRPA